MAKLEMFLPKVVFVAGETVSGQVLFFSSKETDCKTFKVVFEGILTAKGLGIEMSGRARSPVKIPTPAIYTETYVIHHEEIMFAQETTLDRGSTVYEFQFELPEDVEISYDGHNGSVEYLVTATLESSWRSKPKASKSLTIIPTLEEFDDEIERSVVKHNNEIILETEVDSRKYCIESEISFRYRINTDMEFNDLRARIEHVEKSCIAGKKEISHTKVLWQERIAGDSVVRHKWFLWTFKIDKAFPPSFVNMNLQSSVILKVSLTRSLRFDKSAEIDLISGYCPRMQKKIQPLDIPVVEEKPRPTRLKCNTCSYSFKVKDNDIDSGTCPSCGKQIHF